MVKNIAGLLLAFLLGLGLSGCKEKQKSSAELNREKEVKWRERQRQQAIKYYGELIKTFPDSPHVEEAKKKLEALGPATTPVKK